MTTFIDKIAWIYVVDGQILGARSKGKDIYYLPGGKREPGETDIETLLREIEEELSVRIKQETVLHFGTFEAGAHGKSEGMQVKMTCYTGDFDGDLRSASEIEELDWLTYQDRDRVSPVCQIIFDKLREMKLLS
ncbi:NUDIX domain-containing protein [Paenibacillus alginolyticus]|uniref:NUDIX domain-containing protein n=1 Tax=Paenibacillus alginolyticus TaxID=59839 RepID=A0ABT4GKT3_9BACL|nr:NUDIX domain-containing protein [Paenibacillus alginolyticus]MCY9670063.1 NUDIX domain-containing protein [Paenibacillus alginolyticus]MCY9696810.1 NUDIX domain-containing protein [Paenibacillus alginolyticus]MEC0147676.1 NUDIX domain-containing protein [Paenibacillus alginolyticus]